MKEQGMTVDELRRIVRREMDYWNRCESDLSVSAVGACANILAASYGMKAPWHFEDSESIQSKGGKARARYLTPEQRSIISRNAANARWHKGEP